MNLTPDTQTCYNKEETRAIAIALVRGKKAEENHVSDSSRIDLLKANILDYKKNMKDYENTIGVYNLTMSEQKKRYDKNIKHLSNRNKWLKVGWATSVILLSSTTVYFLIR